MIRPYILSEQDMANIIAVAKEEALEDFFMNARTICPYGKECESHCHSACDRFIAYQQGKNEVKASYKDKLIKIYNTLSTIENKDFGKNWVLESLWELIV